MKTACSKIQLCLAVLGVSCLLVQSASATLFFSEAFNYTAGTSLSANSPWSGGSAPYLTIGSGNLTYTGLQDQGGNELSIVNGSATSGFATFASQTSGQIYYSFLFDPLVVNGGNNYVIALNNPSTGSSGAPGGGTDAIDFYYYANGKPELRANAQSATAGTATALTIGQTYLVVEMIDLDAKTASMWINPSSLTFGGSAPTPIATLSGLTATSVNDVGVKAQTSTGQYLVDNILVASTWAEVTPTIPEPSTFALMGLGLGLMAAVIRRRRS
jgi:hypothetical protein